jgi:succinate dehydrogenase/fumarate reductase cytochrome b subunit
MGKLKIEKQYLTVLERWSAAIIGLIFLAFSLYLVFSPPIRQTIVNDSGAIQTTNAFSDQSTVVVFLMTVGGVLFFYAINGLRLNKFTAGPISGESESRQGSTPPLEPSPQAKNEPARSDVDRDAFFDSLTNDEKKIMRTLWRYQRSSFPDDFSKRWTFKIFTNTPEYPAFLMAVGELLGKGLISVNPENEQCALTNEGIILMSTIGKMAEIGEFYVF